MRVYYNSVLDVRVTLLDHVNCKWLADIDGTVQWITEHQAEALTDLFSAWESVTDVTMEEQ